MKNQNKKHQMLENVDDEILNILIKIVDQSQNQIQMAEISAKRDKMKDQIENPLLSIPIDGKTHEALIQIANQCQTSVDCVVCKMIQLCLAKQLRPAILDILYRMEIK